MKKEKSEILKEINLLSHDELKRLAFAFLRIKEHIWQENISPSKSEEYRKREKLRLKIAQKHITTWYNEYKSN